MLFLLCLFANIVSAVTLTTTLEQVNGVVFEETFESAEGVRGTETFVKNAATEILGTSRTPIYIIDNFLSSIKCKRLIKELKPTLKPSGVTRVSSDPYHRTSTTAIFFRSNLQDSVDKKMSDMLPEEKNYELAQIQHYSVSQQFKPHWDAFEPGLDKAYDRLGQRTWTFMMYLNNVEEGGETYFPKLNETIVPKLGKAVLWNNLDANGDINRDTKHEGKPIIKGEKYIITKWFH